MTPKHVLKSLKASRKWLESHTRNPDNPKLDQQAENILVGCSQILRQCHLSLDGWLDRKPYRRGVCQRIQRSWATREGKRTLRDLIRFTETGVEAAPFVKSYWVSALPVEERKPPKPPTEAQLRVLEEGRKRRWKRRRDKGHGPGQRVLRGPAGQTPKTALSNPTKIGTSETAGHASGHRASTWNRGNGPRRASWRRRIGVPRWRPNRPPFSLKLST